MRQPLRDDDDADVLPFGRVELDRLVRQRNRRNALRRHRRVVRNGTFCCAMAAVTAMHASRIANTNFMVGSFLRNASIGRSNMGLLKRRRSHRGIGSWG